MRERTWHTPEMDDWYIIYIGGMGREQEVIGPFRTKSDAVNYFEWPGTRKVGSLYHHPTRHGYIGRKKDFISEGFDWAFKEASGPEMGADIDPGLYYITKDGPDDWTVHGRRHHLKVVRTEGPSGRETRRGEEILHTIYLVKGPGTPGVHAPIDLGDQFEIEPHGFTRLHDATDYAREKLFEYDERVDPAQPRRR